MSTHNRLVEVHGNDGIAHSTAARHLVERDLEPGCSVLSVVPSGIRCDHGNIVWSVTIDGPAPDA